MTRKQSRKVGIAVSIIIISVIFIIVFIKFNKLHNKILTNGQDFTAECVRTYEVQDPPDEPIPQSEFKILTPEEYRGYSIVEGQKYNVGDTIKGKFVIEEGNFVYIKE